ncbi:hypothetical protein M407DRAFT_241055 [Tulasnella calospora MUT 4182]|uniref:Uncharacterized protein n=1 Tax=Tulasnella calospora MUT 4182 TaxID=1051891 RepID=A0A0C3QL87_9AGAM|nr:hypothetical protein M407DRAFT_241055 [Tulasnella calospora MUT 4182]
MASSNVNIGSRSPKSTKSKDSGNGISITSVSVVKKGHPTAIKYSWAFHDKSPDYFAVLIKDVASKNAWVLDGKVSTRGHGHRYKGKYSVDISVAEYYPGKYVLLLVDIRDHDNVFATSKDFDVKKWDF